MSHKTRRLIKKHYDFIEIGTSDFNTLIQKASDSTVGLSVEPLADYLNRLPSKKRVTKVNVAVSNRSGHLDIFYVPDAVRKQYALPSWMKGTNKVGAPHPTVVRYLAKKGLPPTLMKHDRVPVLSIATLFRKYHVGSLDFLKVDTEGHDAVIIGAYIDLIESRPSLKATKIQFESNSLTSKEAVRHLKERLERLGYSVKTQKQDTIATLV
jgi:FkbM family methyltransferase